jgi:diacylglycerol kinase family enzyme
VRALLVVNPKATTTTPRMRDVLARALSSEIKIDTAETTHRGHATQIARDAAADGLDVVVVLGGDGTVSEVANGLVHSATALGIVPGGSANVFGRALGMSPSPVEATSELIEALRAGRRRSINLGRADDRYFTFCAGFGVDAEVIHRIEKLRHAGRAATPARYMRTTVWHYLFGTDRRHPHVTLQLPEEEPVRDLFNGIVANGSPWTYFGSRPVNPFPLASFEHDLDLFSLRKMTVPGSVRIAQQFFEESSRHSRRHVLTMHNIAAFTLLSDVPIAAQVDGDYIGERTSMTFQSVRDALQVVA